LLLRLLKTRFSLVKRGFVALLHLFAHKMGIELDEIDKFYTHVYQLRPRKDHRGVDLISDALPFGRLWYGGPEAAANAIGYAMHSSRSHDAVIRLYDDVGNMIETHDHHYGFKRLVHSPSRPAPITRACS